MTAADDLPDFCPHCGARVTAAGAFCASCGEPLGDAPTRPMRPIPPLPPRASTQRRHGQPPRNSTPDRSVLAIFAVGLALLLVLIGVALYVGGVFSSSNAPSTVASTATASPSSTNTKTSGGTTPSYTAPTPSEGPTTTFTGRMFTIKYPAAWHVRSDEQQHSWGTDTTIVSPTDSTTYLRVDVTPNTTASSPQASAQPVISQLEKDPGYQQLDRGPETLGGLEALHWEFRVDESGATVHKEDLFLIAGNGDGVAVLTQAPDSQYEALRSQFATLRKSLSLNTAPTSNPYSGQCEGGPEDVGSICHAEDAKFCSEHHQCIGRFTTEAGTVVECRDGTYSHSGGISGACSHHEGVARE